MVVVQEAAEQKRKEKNNLYTASRRGQSQSVFLGISISFMILQDSVQTHLFTVFWLLIPPSISEILVLLQQVTETSSWKVTVQERIRFSRSPFYCEFTFNCNFSFLNHCNFPLDCSFSSLDLIFRFLSCHAHLNILWNLRIIDVLLLVVVVVVVHMTRSYAAYSHLLVKLKEEEPWWC